MRHKSDAATEQYKEEQKKRMAALKVGAKDASGNIITKVFARGDEYLIYEIDTKDLTDSIKVWIDTMVEEDRRLIHNFDRVRGKFAEVKGLLYKVIDQATAKSLIAHSLVQALTNSPEEAIREFSDLEARIYREYREQFNNRLKYLISSLVLAVLFIALAIYEKNTHRYYDASAIRGGFIHQIIYILGAGCLGGFFSISNSVNKLVCQQDVDSWLYILYGMERMIISLLAAVIVYFAILTNVVFGFCEKLGNPLIGYVLFAVLAGFSETLVPNLLVKLEKKDG